MSPISSAPTGPPIDASTRSPSTSAPYCAPSPPAAPPCSAGISTCAPPAATPGPPTSPAATATAPKWQALLAARWIDARMARLLPTPYFHVVFTLPAALRGLVLHNRRRLALLFAAAAQTLLALGRDPRRLGATLGITAVLHRAALSRPRPRRRTPTIAPAPLLAPSPSACAPQDPHTAHPAPCPAAKRLSSTGRSANALAPPRAPSAARPVRRSASANRLVIPSTCRFEETTPKRGCRR